MKDRIVEQRPKENWETIERPGYLGKRKDEYLAVCDQKYGEGNWRLVNVTREGQIMTYDDIFWKVYLSGYVRHILVHSEEIQFLTDNYSFAYDKHMITRKQAFDPYALYNKPGIPNQFHHTALNIALEWYLGIPFKGDRPIQVRQGKPGTPRSTWPEGWRWSPGFIKCTRPDLIPDETFEGWWEDKESIEAFYQYTKALQVKVS